jgi:hypothetical protein
MKKTKEEDDPLHGARQETERRCGEADPKQGNRGEV